jgi:hypothetical protein
MAGKVFIILLCLFCFIAAYFLKEASPLETDLEPASQRNPFFRAGEDILSYGVKSLGKGVGTLKLEATFISGKDRIALISGRILKEGQTFEGRQVISISQDQVFLKDIGEVVILNLPALYQSTTK